VRDGLLLVAFLGLILIASPQAGRAQAGNHPLEYKGLQLGMNRDAALKAMRQLEQREFDERCPGGACPGDSPTYTDLEARHIPDCSDSECDNGGALTVYLNGGRVYGIQQNLGGEDVGAYVLAFTKKYGGPRVEKRTYRNGLGNEFHGNAYVWTRGRAFLEVQEICVDGLDKRSDFSDIGCFFLYSDAYAPKKALPKI
jgi:hypothetical protein